MAGGGGATALLSAAHNGHAQSTYSLKRVQRRARACSRVVLVLEREQRAASLRAFAVGRPFKCWDAPEPAVSLQNGAVMPLPSAVVAPTGLGALQMVVGTFDLSQHA
eukprot:353350-Chlamydomonas_euryale.AAC.11